MAPQEDLALETIDVEVAIVGSGFSGLAMAQLLKSSGVDDFVILEKGGAVGGTWRENTYPGAACDIPSHLYSFSFAPNPDWSHVYAPQGEILAYLQRCADRFGLTPHLRFNHEVTEARFDEVGGRWQLRTRQGGRFSVRALVLGNGALHLPSLPDIPGLSRFDGPQFHSAQWRHDVPLEGRRVAVIGTGASAVQFVPQIAPIVGRLHVFQRTAPWILPRGDRAYTSGERATMRRARLLQRLRRWALYWGLEWRAAGFLTNSPSLGIGERLAKRHLRKAVPDPTLREALTPRYRMGCKRVLLSDDYYPAFTRPNVELVTDGISEITASGIRTRDGAERQVDVIIHGTGFDVARYLAPIQITGRNGVDLATVWGDAPRTHLGITVHGFPNLFLLMGPNTGLGHNSMIFMIEAQAQYALSCIQALRQRDAAWLEVREEVQAAFDAELQARMTRTVWQAGGCRSWYQSPDGRISTLWPGFTVEYWWRTRALDLGEYRVQLKACR